MPTEQATTALDRAEVEYELLPHARTERAALEAEVLGLSAADVAKTLVLVTPDGYLRAVLSASDRLDMRKLRDVVAVGKKHLRLATEDELGRDYPEFELGAVPPFGGARSEPVLVDRRLAERDSVVLEAGSHEASVRLRTEDLLRVTDARVVDLAGE